LGTIFKEKGNYIGLIKIYNIACNYKKGALLDSSQALAAGSRTGGTTL